MSLAPFCHHKSAVIEASGNYIPPSFTILIRVVGFLSFYVVILELHSVKTTSIALNKGIYIIASQFLLTLK